MNSSRGTRARTTVGDGLAFFWRKLRNRSSINRGAAWGAIIVGALAAFEFFNFSTTEYALRDLLGNLTFVGLPWATVLAIAFCGIDFAGIARIFTPGDTEEGAAGVWYLFGAWLLAACFNAALTWWGISIAILNQARSAGAVWPGGQTVTTGVPVFIALLVWLVRVLIIGTLSAAGDRLFSTVSTETPRKNRPIEMLGRLRPRRQPDSAF